MKNIVMLIDGLRHRCSEVAGRVAPGLAVFATSTMLSRSNAILASGAHLAPDHMVGRAPPATEPARAREAA